MKRKYSVIVRSRVHGAVLGTRDEERLFVRPDAAAPVESRLAQRGARDGGDGGERERGRADAQSRGR